MKYNIFYCLSYGKPEKIEGILKKLEKEKIKHIIPYVLCSRLPRGTFTTKNERSEGSLNPQPKKRNIHTFTYSINNKRRKYYDKKLFLLFGF